MKTLLLLAASANAIIAYLLYFQGYTPSKFYLAFSLVALAVYQLESSLEE